MNILKSWLILMMCMPLLAPAADWPGFLGPERTGVAREALKGDIAVGEPLWRKQIGVGFSSIAVSGDRLFTLGHADDTETVWCLEPATGETIWKHSYPGKLLPNLHEGGPASTPMVDGERVYTLGKQGQLFCLQASDGKIFWQQDVREAHGVKVPEWGFSATPLIDGDRLLLDVGPTVCLDKHSGKTIWSTKKAKAGYGSVMRFVQGGKSYYGVLNNEALVILQAEKGEQAAFYKWPTSFETNATTPLVRDGKIFVSTAYNKGCVLLKFDGSSLTPLYENKEMRNHMNNSVPFGEHLFGFDRKAHNRRLVTLRCMEWNTGKVTWSQENFGCGSLIRAGEHLIVLSDQGELIVAKADVAAFSELARGKILEGKCWAPPALADGVVYARDAKGTLVAVRVGE